MKNFLTKILLVLSLGLFADTSMASSIYVKNLATHNITVTSWLDMDQKKCFNKLETYIIKKGESATVRCPTGSEKCYLRVKDNKSDNVKVSCAAKDYAIYCSFFSNSLQCNHSKFPERTQ